MRAGPCVIPGVRRRCCSDARARTRDVIRPTRAVDDSFRTAIRSLSGGSGMTAFWHHHSLRRPLGRAPRSDRCERRDSLAPSVRRALKTAAYRDCDQRCVYCGWIMPFSEATLDHVQPIARGGRSQPGNLVVACGPCNRLKADQHPQDFFARWPSAGENFMRYARAVHRALKRSARRAVSLAWAEAA